MKKIIQATQFLLSFLIVAPAFSQIIADPTTWTYDVKKTGTNEYELVFHLSIKDGWHIFSQNPGDEFLIPPSFVFSKNNGVKLAGKVQESGKLHTEKMDGIDNPIRYFEGTVTYVQKVKAKPATVISGEQEYQVCNNKICLPPKKKTFVFNIPK